jgi:hypothetical protein
MRHEVDAQLPHDALRSAQAGSDLADVQSRYREPIVAMQDDDLEFPRPIKFAYYAVYNCFRRHALVEEIDPWLIVNQVRASIEDERSWLPRWRLPSRRQAEETAHRSTRDWHFEATQWCLGDPFALV